LRLPYKTWDAVSTLLQEIFSRFGFSLGLQLFKSYKNLGFSLKPSIGSYTKVWAFHPHNYFSFQSRLVSFTDYGFLNLT
jgi:hypothetical protein